jgi:hypothetical protein
MLNQDKNPANVIEKLYKGYADAFPVEPAYRGVKEEEVHGFVVSLVLERTYWYWVFPGLSGNYDIPAYQSR